ncbi:MAG: type II toxin-antitoxin system death-on-curing family toxin [Bacteroidota bacterium]|nr:type II toxin-antitoxin system death-on-curing family toxin [Bacteroidota bacterium]
MILLTKDQILYLNENNVKKFGGNFMAPHNLLHESALDYLVDIIDKEAFGQVLYPEIYHKAGVYLFNIISNHIFSDGNKRTGLDATILFLYLNGFQLSSKVSNDTLTDFILDVASGKYFLEEVQKWIKENIEKR